jgi:hypothetical protein
MDKEGSLKVERHKSGKTSVLWSKGSCVASTLLTQKDSRIDRTSSTKLDQQQHKSEAVEKPRKAASSPKSRLKSGGVPKFIILRRPKKKAQGPSEPSGLKGKGETGEKGQKVTDLWSLIQVLKAQQQAESQQADWNQSSVADKSDKQSSSTLSSRATQYAKQAFLKPLTGKSPDSQHQSSHNLSSPFSNIGKNSALRKWSSKLRQVNTLS